MLKYKKSGFSLAEVLLTLSIIGVIAAITIPTVFYNTNNDKFTAGLVKVYRELDNATKQIINDEGSESLVGVFDNDTVMFNKFKNVMSVSKACTTALGNCWPSAWKMLGGADPDTPISAEPGIILTDGTYLVFKSDQKNCSNDRFKINGSNAQCGKIYADVNGVNPPNRMGRDIFLFKLAKDGLHLAGSTGDDWASATNANCTAVDASNTSGYGCAVRVIRENAINY